MEQHFLTENHALQPGKMSSFLKKIPPICSNKFPGTIQNTSFSILGFMKQNNLKAKALWPFFTLFLLTAGILIGCATSTVASENTPRPSWVNDEIYPFESLYFDWNGYRLHYIDEQPEGEIKGTVVAIHGNGTWSIIYRKMITGLKAQGFRVVAMDHFGFGLSDFPHPQDFDYMPHSQAQVVKDLVESLDLQNITMVLQDWGGPIGLAVAQAMPERMSGFLLMNTWAWPLPAYPEGEFNPYHAVHDRGRDAIMNPSFYLNGNLVRGGARGLARRNAEKGSSKYAALEQMQMAPYIDLEDPSELLYQGVTLPVWISARSTVEDANFLASIEANMDKINTLPVYFMFGDDTAFGPLKVDLGMHEERPLCPEGYVPESDELSWNTNCVNEKGELTWPYLDRFLSLWNANAVVGVWQNPSYGHWLQDEVPEDGIEGVLKIWDASQK